MLQERSIERRRTIRIRRSSLLDQKLDDIDRPSIKIAETADELAQAFRLVHSTYTKSGYVKNPHPSGMLYSMYSLLPSTSVFVFKEYLTVLSTLTQIADTPQFGLPMDSLYKPELDSLREQGRRVVEIGALATPPRRRWSNLIMLLAKALFQYCKLTKVDDMCIMVNPKHVGFYQQIFLFEPFGEERMYEAVGAPAVALRVDFQRIAEQLRTTYSGQDFETDLYSYFVKINNVIIDPNIEYPVSRNRPLDYDAARHFFEARPDVLENLSDEQMRYIESVYHKALYAGGGSSYN